MGKLLKGGVLGGLVLFLWGVISWTVLDWHSSTLEKFPNEGAASAFINQLPKSGMYLQKPELSLGGQEQSATKGNAPIIFAAVSNNDPDTNMVTHLVLSLITQIIAAIIITGLVLIKPHIQFGGRLFQVILFALAAGIVTYVPYMNWFHFSFYYTLISIIDLLIGWFLAGMVISYFTRPKYPNFY